MIAETRRLVTPPQGPLRSKGESVLVSFARHGRSHVQPFPRKRESTLQAIGNGPPTDWIR